jgi:hypothetical protein
MGLQSFLLVFLTSLAVGPAAGLPRHEVPARVEVLEGRASVGLPSAVLRLEAGAPRQQFVGPVHLEVAVASRARVGWSGMGSLLLEGRGVVEWAAPRERDELMRWTFVEVTRASLELRRGRVHVELPGGWRGLLQPGAYTLSGLPGGPVELHHDAGLPVTLWPPSIEGRPKAQPPFTVLAGGAVRLLGEAPRPVTLPSSADAVQAPHDRLGFESQVASVRRFPAWKGFSWPWARPTEASARQPLALPGHGPLGERVVVPRSSPRASADPTNAVAEDEPAGEAAGAPAPRASRPPDGDAGGSASAPVLADGAGGPQPEPPPGSATGPAEPVGKRLPLWTFLPLRSSGEMVLTPYGPRWIDVAELLSRLHLPAEPTPVP